MSRKISLTTGLVILPFLFAFFLHASPGVAAEWDHAGDYLDEISEEGTYNWPKEKFPIKVFIEPGGKVPGFQNSYPQILRSCFDEWAVASANRVSWVEVESSEEADLVCSWSPQAREREEGTEAGNTRTYTKFNTETNHGLIYKATMSLVTRLPDRQMTPAEIKRTFLHEVGHAFGLSGHSPYRSDIMFASVSRKHLPVLTGRDRATILRLYKDYEPQQALTRQPAKSS